MHRRFTWGWAHLAILSVVLAFACGPATAGTISIVTSNMVLPIPDGTWNLTGFTGSANLTLDGPVVTQEIYADGYPFSTPDTSGSFLLPVNLDGLDLSLPAQFDSNNIFGNGTLTYTPPGSLGTAVDVVLQPYGRGFSDAITANFRLYSTPEPGGWLLIGTGALALTAILKRRRV